MSDSVHVVFGDNHVALLSWVFLSDFAEKKYAVVPVKTLSASNNLYSRWVLSKARHNELRLRETVKLPA